MTDQENNSASENDLAISEHDQALKKYNNAVFGEGQCERSRAQNALEQAYKNRDFEIEMYWKRATYFFAFIAGSFTLYKFSLGTYMDTGAPELTLLSLITGLVFSIAFYLSSLGSKFWQENWESHIDFLEKFFQGNLYKSVLRNNNKIYNVIAAKPFSVSKINTALSLYIVLAWIYLLGNWAYINNKDINLIDDKCCIFIVLSILTLLILLLLRFLKSSFINKCESSEISSTQIMYHRGRKKP